MPDTPKPCPFCGCRAITIEHDPPTVLTVKCAQCAIRMVRRMGKDKGFEETYIMLLEKWNRRTPP